MDGIDDEKETVERRQAEANERETEVLEKSRNYAGAVKQTNWSIGCSQTRPD